MELKPAVEDRGRRRRRLRENGASAEALTFSGSGNYSSLSTYNTLRRPSSVGHGAK